MDLAIDREPSRESNYLDLAMILTEHGRHPVALVPAKKAIEAAPDSYQAHRWEGFIETKLHYSLEAIKSYSRAVEIKPDAAEALIGLAVAQMNEGNLQDAQATFQKGIERFPRDALLRQEYGRMLILWGNRDTDTESRAVALLKEALAVDGTLAESHFQLGKLAMRDGKNQEALDHLETAVTLSPRNRGVHYALAGLYRRLGRREEAAKKIRKFESLKEGQDESVPGVRAQEARPSAIEGASDIKPPARQWEVTTRSHGLRAVTRWLFPLLAGGGDYADNKAADCRLRGRDNRGFLPERFGFPAGLDLPRKDWRLRA